VSTRTINLSSGIIEQPLGTALSQTLLSQEHIQQIDRKWLLCASRTPSGARLMHGSKFNYSTLQQHNFCHPKWKPLAIQTTQRMLNFFYHPHLQQKLCLAALTFSQSSGSYGLHRQATLWMKSDEAFNYMTTCTPLNATGFVDRVLTLAYKMQLAEWRQG
jgi:hypothetical protein